MPSTTHWRCCAHDRAGTARGGSDVHVAPSPRLTGADRRHADLDRGAYPAIMGELARDHERPAAQPPDLRPEAGGCGVRPGAGTPAPPHADLARCTGASPTARCATLRTTGVTLPGGDESRRAEAS